MINNTRQNESHSQISVTVGEGFSVLCGALHFFSTKMSISYPTAHLLSFLPMVVELLHTLQRAQYMTRMELALIQESVVKFHDLSYSRHQTQRLQYSLPIAVHEPTLLGVLAAVLGFRSCICLFHHLCPVIQDSISFISSPIIWLGEMYACGGVEGLGLQVQKCQSRSPRTVLADSPFA